MKPLISVYVPAYNRPKTLDRLLASIDYRAAKVIVSDDSGTGSLAPVAVKYPVDYQPQRYNIGRDANVLRALAVCDTEYLWVVGDDDWLLPGALDVVLRWIGEEAPDRLILHSEAAAPVMPLSGVVGTAPMLIDAIRSDPSLLIASTLCTANVYRTATLDIAEGLRHMDSWYSYSWATQGCKTWAIPAEPTIGVGVDNAYTIDNAPRFWQEYLDGLTTANGVAPIPVNDARRWNFASVATPRVMV